MLEIPLIFAAGLFESWLLLGWTAAAAAPILIHLWNQKNYREAPWAAMSFLLAALEKHSRRMHLEQWLLLALRTLILLLFGLALANPGCDRTGQTAQALAPTEAVHTVLVLDASYSMRFREGGQTLFEQAQEKARALVAASPRGDSFTLVLLADPAEIVIGRPSVSRDDVSNEIAALSPTDGGAELTAALTLVEQILQNAKQSRPDTTRQQIVLYSDLQSTTWKVVAGRDFRRRLAQLSDKASLSVVEVGAARGENLAISAFDVDQNIIVAGRSVVFRAALQNHAPLEQKELLVELLVDGRLQDQQTVDIPANGQATVLFPYEFAAPGEKTLEVRTKPDRLERDNHRWLALSVQDSIDALCVRTQEGDARNAAFALNPGGAGETGVRVDVMEVDALRYSTLERYDVVFLCDVGSLDPAAAKALERFVVQGGGLTIFAGDALQPTVYNQEIGPASPHPLLPARLGGVLEGAVRFDPREYEHAIVSPFRGHQQSGLLTTPIWKTLQLEDVAAAANVALYFDSGAPAIVEQAVGQGRVLVIATSISSGADAWSALAAWPSFPPLMQEILNVALRCRAEVRNTLVGLPLTGKFPESLETPSAAMLLPDEQRQPLAPKARNAASSDPPSQNNNNNAKTWTFTDTFQSGVYRLESGSTNLPARVYAVNVDTREGVLERVSREELPAQFRFDAVERVRRVAASSGGRRDEYFRLFLGAVAALLFVESVLAWWMGPSR